MKECCNDKALMDAVLATGESKKLVEQMIDHQSKLIAFKIREGAMESVRITGFGVFTAKLREVTYRNFVMSLPKATVRKSKKK